MVLLFYKYIGLTGSTYVAIPCVAPIALGGFYSFNGMNFYEYMEKTQSEITTSESAVKKQEEFEEMKKKTRNMMFGLAAVFVLAVAGVAAYKAMH